MSPWNIKLTAGWIFSQQILFGEHSASTRSIFTLDPPISLLMMQRSSFYRMHSKQSRNLYISALNRYFSRANSLTYVERYHKIMRKALNVTKSAAPLLDDDAILQISVNAVNEFVRPHGLVSTLFVCGSLPRLGFPTDLPSKSAYQRAASLKQATEEMKFFSQSTTYDWR